MEGFWLRSLDLILPRFCVHCQAALRGEKNPLFCRDCWSSVLPLKGPVCPVCGHPFRSRLATMLSPTHRCGSCRRYKPRFDRAISVGLYEGVLKQAIHEFKYSKHPNLVEPLADFLLKGVDSSLDIDYLVPVPLHPRRLKDRQYNQALLLCDAMARRHGFRVIPDGLERHRETLPQIGLPYGERRRNVRGVFRAPKSSRIRKKNLLLVDDVMTSGATASECARALKRAGAKAVFVLTVARTVAS